MNQPRSEISPVLLKNRERAALAMKLRVAGWTLEQIADHPDLNYYSRSSVSKALRTHLRWAMKNTPEVKEMRELQAKRLEGVQAAHWANRQDPRSAHVILAAIKEYDELFGLKVNESRIAGAVEASALAELATTLNLQPALIRAMIKAGVDPELQEKIVNALSEELYPQREGESEDIEGEIEEDDEDV